MSSHLYENRVQIAVLLFLGLVMPCVILFSGVRLFPRLSSIDPWLYVGGFLNLEELYERFGQTYYMSRLPWLLLGKAAYSVLPPATSHIILGFAVYFLFTGSLFFIARKFYGTSIALFVAAFAGSNPLLIFHAFWAHVDVPSISLALAAVAALLGAEGKRMRPMAMLAGAVLAVAVTTHLFSIVVFAPAVLVYAVLDGRISKARAAARCGYLALGFFGGMSALGFAGYLVYEDPFFWMAQLRIAGWVVKGGWHRWAKPLSDWMPAGALVIPLALIFSSLVLTFTRFAHISQDRGARFLYPYLWLILSVFLITDFGMGGARLQHAWYYTFLIGPSILLFAPLLHHLIDSDREETFRRLLCGYAGVAVATFVVAGRFHFNYLIPTYPLFISSLVLMLALLLVSKSWVKTVTSLSLSLLLFFSCTYGNDLPDVFPKTDQRKDFEQCIGLYRAVEPHLPEDRSIWFLYNNEPETRYVFNSVNALYLWGFSLLSNELPEIPEARRRHLDRPSSVVILAKDEADVDAGLKRLKELYYLESVPVRETLISRDETFQLAIAHASPRKP